MAIIRALKFMKPTLEPSHNNKESVEIQNNQTKTNIRGKDESYI